jgi:predicted nucleic acid-binding protein
MSVFIVDVSVGVKWMLPEPYAAEALRLQTSAHQLHAPAFFDVELANVLWKTIRQGLLSRSQADVFLSQLPALPLTRHSDEGLVAPAFDLADKTQRTVYDCLYLALAVQLGGQMVTADERLVNALAGTAWASNILRLQDVP